MWWEEDVQKHTGDFQVMETKKVEADSLHDIRRRIRVGKRFPEGVTTP